jgi:adenylate kinase family enzyme
MPWWCVSGAPGAGKTTWVRERLLIPGREVISTDDYLETHSREDRPMAIATRLARLQTTCSLVVVEGCEAIRLVDKMSIEVLVGLPEVCIWVGTRHISDLSKAVRGITAMQLTKFKNLNRKMLKAYVHPLEFVRAGDLEKYRTESGG